MSNKTKITGERYASDHGQYLKSGGEWYALMTDLKWHKKVMYPRVLATLKLVESNASINVWEVAQ
ncbi:hypothetical protein [Enterobacter quasihormaechei]|uniref:hypothetical protein n=1 Tax=Enterobacter TaxID=547 RepID=UPI002B1D28FD|nr:hypothetical protein [Enterobacter quasihormaechei]MEA3785459.1 hypothetical protein [Enterobacter quasihormaechei]MEA3873191.1 hypothetical protein [Enterobacter quasihormaechei]